MGYVSFQTDPLTSYIFNSNHALIAGATGSGKSTLLETFIFNLCRFPVENVAFAVIDLKRISLSRWKKAPNCRRYAVTPEEAEKLINDFVFTMENRYKEMERRNITKWDGNTLFLIIDEAADLLDTVPQCRQNLVKLLRLARATSIHLIYATQDPSKRTIFAAIQQNIDCCVGLRCRDAIASRQIVGVAGCENLPKYGEALIYTPDLMKVYKVNVLLTSEDDINKILMGVN